MSYYFWRSSLLLLILSTIACSDTSYQWRLIDITGYRPALSLTMQSTKHPHTVTAADFINKVVVLNFGFTHCRDVCPIGLHQLKQVLAQVKHPDLVVLFVSVDPKRDTLDKLRQYTQAFGDNIIGLTHDMASVQALANRYKASIDVGDSDETGHYDIVHDQTMTVFDKAGKARLLIRPDHSTDEIVSDLQRLLQQ